MRVTEMLLAPPRPARPVVDYRRVFAWWPVMTADEGRIWMRYVWRISVEQKRVYSRSILAF